MDCRIDRYAISHYHLLEELRFGRLSEKSRLMISEKIKDSQNSKVVINTTHVVGLRDSTLIWFFMTVNSNRC
ncbi:8456_t:CDS:2 [Entrophospora sp. SA101]|nr:8456_t:CDS:2 [Entrophospora sp. SA101]